ncbi:MAG: serine hydrolase domain-containing protein [Rhodothermales bacterium]
MKNLIFALSLVLLIASCKSTAEEIASEEIAAEKIKAESVWMPASMPLSVDAREVFEEMEQAIQADSFPRTTSVLLLKNDEMVYEGYFGDGHKDLLNDTRSATKSLTALTVGVAIDEGLLTLDQSVFDILEDRLAPYENDGPLKRKITVADLLTMSSALECNDNDMGSPGNEENMYPLRHWARWAADIPTRAVYDRDENGRGSFAYCTAGSFLLGQVIEEVSGETLDQFFARTLFEPLGISTWHWSRSPTGEYMSGGGLRLHARDLAKIGLMVLDEGQWQGEQVVPAAWIQKATTPSVNAGATQDYGFQFWQRTWKTSCGPMKASYMSGNGGNNVIILPAFDAVIVLTRQNYGQRGMHQQSNRLVENYVLASMECEM